MKDIIFPEIVFVFVEGGHSKKRLRNDLRKRTIPVFLQRSCTYYYLKRARVPCKKILRSNSDSFFLSFGSKSFLGSAGAIYRGADIKKRSSNTRTWNHFLSASLISVSLIGGPTSPQSI